jgi:tetratricopeptide (TPR) repeat protein
MIIFGSRMYGKRNLVEGWGQCEHCGTYGKVRSYNARKWGHLYFIPLIPEGPRVRVVKECRSCSHGLHIPETEVPGVLESVSARNERALAALDAGEAAFVEEDDGSRTDAVATLAGSVELLIGLGDDGRVGGLLDTLRAGGHTLAYHMVEGAVQEFEGALDDAAASYEAAAEAAPDDPTPLVWLGAVRLRQGRADDARRAYEAALPLADEGGKVLLLQDLITVYEALDDYDRAAATYEQCFELAPPLREEKKFVKAYRRACKRAMRTPVEL